jgi:acetyl esterase/lipase
MAKRPPRRTCGLALCFLACAVLAAAPAGALAAPLPPASLAKSGVVYLPLINYDSTAARVWRDLVYAEVEGQSLKLDLYLPRRRSAPAPLVLWLHGGGWRGGDKAPAPAAVLQLVEDGIAVASVDYRLTTDTRFQHRIFPAQIHDLKGAVRFLRAHAPTYRLDAERFGVWGASAGGHLAALLGLSGGDPALEGTVGGHLEQSSRVAAVVDFFGPTQLETQGGVHDLPGAPEAALIGAPLGQIKAHMNDPSPPWPELVGRMLAAGPVHHVDAADPPVFIAHGAADLLVPPDQSARLAAALRAAGVEVESFIVPGVGHEFSQMPLARAREFLRRQLLAEAPSAPKSGPSPR